MNQNKNNVYMVKIKLESYVPIFRGKPCQEFSVCFQNVLWANVHSTPIITDSALWGAFFRFIFHEHLFMSILK